MISRGNKTLVPFALGASVRIINASSFTVFAWPIMPCAGMSASVRSCSKTELARITLHILKIERGPSLISWEEISMLSKKRSIKLRAETRLSIELDAIAKNQNA